MTIIPKQSMIRGAVLMRTGEVAPGHNLQLDALGISQACSLGRGKETVPVMLGTSDGASDCAQVCGFVSNFRLHGDALLGDVHLLESHPRRDVVIEMSQRCPDALTLQPGFSSPATAPKGVARFATLDNFVISWSGKPRVTEFSAAGAATAAAAAAGRRVAQEGLRWPKPLPAPLNGWKTTGKRFLRTNKGTLIRAGLDGAVVGTAVYTGSKLAQKADDEKRRAKLKRMSAELGNAIELSRASLTRVVDAAGRNIEAPDIPLVEQAKTADRFINHHPTLRRALLKAAGLAAGATAGGYVGHRMHGASRKGFIRGGAVAGGLAAATLFESPMTTPDDLVTDLQNQIGRAAAPVRTACSESHMIPSLATRLGCTEAEAQAWWTQLAERPVYENRDGGPWIFDSNDLNAAREQIAAEAVAQALEGVEGDDHQLRATADQALATFAGKVTPTELARQPWEKEPSTLGKVAKVAAVGAGALAAGSLIRGVGALGTTRAAQAGLLAAARFGGRKLTRDAQGVLERAMAAMRR